MSLVRQNQSQNQDFESSDRLLLSESDIIHLLLEFLTTRGLTDSSLVLEKETRIVNEILASPDLLFLRNLVVEGRWDDVLEFLQPLEEAFRSFPGKKVRATILKHRFLDMLLSHYASGHELSMGQEESKSVVERIVKVLNELESVCDSKEEYSSLCLLLTSPSRLAEHSEYKDWKSSTSRIACFTALRPLVQKFIPPPAGPPKVPPKVAKNDRLVQLLIKGLLYETCCDYCKSKAIDSKGPSTTGTGSTKGSGQNSNSSSITENNSLNFSGLLAEAQLSESDLSLPSWLKSLPNNIFNSPFQKKNLRLDMEPLPKPQKILMNVSIMDSASDLLSRSMASTSFHLSTTETAQQQDLRTMTTSVDRLFGELSDSVQGSSNIHNQHLNQHLNQSRASPRPPHLNSQSISSRISEEVDNETDVLCGPNTKARFIAVTTLEDVQAVRCAEFHPSGKVYAIGSNSKTLRVCLYPNIMEVTENHTSYQPTILFKRTKHHKGSIYCLGWSPCGNLLATGSNDKTVKLLRFEDMTSSAELTGTQEIELSMHDGTVRDICFIEEVNKKSSLLVSGGAGDCKIYVTDCGTATPFQALSGHTGPILSLYNWGGQIFCSGSQDKTIRFWDLRTRGCVDVFTPLTSNASTKSPVASVAVEPSGRLLMSGHEDSFITLHDIRGQRQIQAIKTHSADVRSVRFSPSAYYLLSGGYDNRLVLSDLQGDLSVPLPSVVVAQHQDKVISGRWHPAEFSFISTSADKTCCLFALPPEND